MGMTFVLRRATDQQIATLRARPELIEQFLFDEPREAAVAKMGLLDRLVEHFGFKTLVDPLAGDREDGDEVELDKSWHLMHFLLTGSGEPTGTPLSFLVEDWPKIGSVDVGWGPAQAIPARDLARFNEALQTFASCDLRARVDTDEMLRQELYLAESFAEDPEDSIAYVEHWLQRLRAFVAGCVARNAGAIAFIT